MCPVKLDDQGGEVFHVQAFMQIFRQGSHTAFAFLFRGIGERVVIAGLFGRIFFLNLLARINKRSAYGEPQQGHDHKNAGDELLYGNYFMAPFHKAAKIASKMF
jgi:hypothetical protein